MHHFVFYKQAIKFNMSWKASNDIYMYKYVQRF